MMRSYASSNSATVCCRVSSSTDTTTYCAKYRIRSRFRGDRSSSSPNRLGTPLENQMCATGDASSMCPIRSRRTFARVTSTPQRSHFTPLNRIFLYFPHAHSQSFVGPKIRSQNSPSRSGRSVR